MLTGILIHFGKELEKITTEEAIKRDLIPDSGPIIVMSCHGHCPTVHDGFIEVEKEDIPQTAIAYVLGQLRANDSTGYAAIQFYKKPEKIKNKK